MRSFLRLSQGVDYVVAAWVGRRPASARAAKTRSLERPPRGYVRPVLTYGRLLFMTRASILEEALRLPVEERAKLITELIATVDDGSTDDPAEVEQAWAAELEVRIASADANPDAAIDWVELRAQLKTK